MATWPSTLPRPLRDGHQASVGGNVIRSDTESGPARQRLRYGDAPDDLNIAWRFTPAEMIIFKDFWRDEINRGADWFLMDLHRGDGLQTYEVRIIGGNYQDMPMAGLKWQVSCKLDVRSTG